MKKDLEDIRNGAGDVRAFRHIDGHINSVEDYSKHPEGCTCGHCGKDHDHKTMGHVPKHTHGDACGCGHDHDHDHDHEEHSHEHGDDCCCGNDHKHEDEEHAHAHAHGDECGCGHDHDYEHEHTHAHGDDVAADTTTATSINMLMHTDITFPVILLTVIAKSAIRMRSTAMYAAKAWLIAPAVCRMPIKLSAYIFCKTLAVLTALPKWNTKSKSCRV